MTRPAKAIVILGHGSRVPEANASMVQVASLLKEKYGYPIVEVCNMSRLGPYLEDALKNCIDAGATNITVIPYFLHEGLHMRLDIPRMMQEYAFRYPHVRFVFGRNLGFDESLVDLVQKRIVESAHLSDVRDLALPDEEQYPIPPGQHEFVGMTPEDARQWRQRNGKK
jgi:sirohydrochlorin ferrochelatase